MKDKKNGGARTHNGLFLTAAVLAVVLVTVSAFVLLPERTEEQENEVPLGAGFYYTDPATNVRLYYETTSESPKEVRASRYASGIDASGHLKIPEKVEYLDSVYTVTSVKEMFFYAGAAVRAALKSVELPETVTSLDADAFSGCENLKSINLENVTYIGNFAFYMCKSLPSVDISNVTYVGKAAFDFCNALRSVDLPSATFIGQQAFANCNELSSIALSPDLKTVEFGAFYSPKLNTVAVPYKMEGKEGKDAYYPNTKIVYFDSAAPIKAVRNGSNIELSSNGGDILKIIVGTAYGQNNTATIESAPWSFAAPLNKYYAKISQLDPAYYEPSPGPITYDPDRTLANVPLPEKWSWLNDKLCPAVNVNGYWAVYTPANGNYESVTKMIALTVMPRPLTEPAASDAQTVYNGAERTLSLVGFDTGTMTVAGDKRTNSGNYTAVVKLKDAVNYVWSSGVKEVSISWSIKKADAEDDPRYREPAPPEITYNPSGTLNNVTLPPGWSWVYPDIVPTVNITEYPAKYTPLDGNYESVTKLISLTVKPLTLTDPAAPVTVLTYNGNEITLGLINFDPATMTVTGNKQTNFGHNYLAVIKLKDPANYAWSSGAKDVSIIWSIKQADGKDDGRYTEPDLGAITYSPDKTLADVTLPEGWSWINSNLCPTVNIGEYWAIYTPENPNYGTVTKLIPLKVSPIVVPVPTAPNTELVYNGKERELAIEGLSLTTMTVTGHKETNSAHNYVATIKLKDPVNYAWENGSAEVKITWCIHRADGTTDPDYRVPVLTPVTYDPARTLNSAELPEGWSWVYPGTRPTANVGVYPAKYTPKDPNYEPVTELIPLKVNPIVVPVPTATENSFVYSGSTKELPLTGFNPATMNITGNTAKNVGNYEAAVTLKDAINYVWSAGGTKVSIGWHIGPGDGRNDGIYTKPDLAAITYNPARTLANVVLPAGWSWDNSSAVPTVNVGEYWATYTPADGNYETVSELVQLTVDPLKLAGPVGSETIFEYDRNEKSPVLTGFDPATMKITGNKAMNVNTYEAIVTLKDPVNYAWADGAAEVSIPWEITAAGEGDPDYEEPDPGSVEYDPNGKLSLIPGLPKGWAWDSPDTVPTVDVKAYSATYTPADDNYTGLTKLIYLNVTPKVLTAPTATYDSFKYKAAIITLIPDGLDLVTMDITGDAAGNVGSYEAIVTLKDAVNYAWSTGVTEVKVPWTIYSAPATDDPEYSPLVYAEITYDPTKTLGDVKLPNGWSWDSPDTVPTVNGGPYWAVYTPSDPENYDYLMILEPVTVNKKKIDVPAAANNVFVYSNETKTLIINGLNDLMTVTGNTGKDVGTYTAVITLKDPVNYAWAGGVTDVGIPWQINADDVTNDGIYTEPTPPAITYDPKKTLADVILPPGWSWVYEDVCPTVNVGQYPAIYVPQDSNYGSVTKLISLKVNPIVVPIPAAPETVLIYNGSERTLGILGLTDAMSVTGNVQTDFGHRYLALITLNDPVNYRWSANVSVVSIAWCIHQADAKDDGRYTEPGPEAITYDPKKTLSDVPLPPGWVWVNTDKMPTVNIDGYHAMYIPLTDNYETVTKLIPLKVNPLIVPVPTAPVTTFIYNGSAWTLNIIGLNDTMTVTGNVETDFGHRYLAVITLNDPVNYAWSTGVPAVSITWCIHQADAGTDGIYTDPDLKAFTYDPKMTLAGVVLPPGWSWVYPDIVPTVNIGSYPAIYLPLTDNYETVSMLISLEVLPFEVSVPTAPVTVFVYDGTEKTLIILGLTDFMIVTGHMQTAFGHNYTAAVKLEDPVNYKWAGNVTEVIFTWCIDAAAAENDGRYTEPGLKTITYDPDRTLADVTLPPGWSWAAGEKRPIVKISEYWATYTPLNDNYGSLTKLISLTVLPYRLDVPVAVNDMFLYDSFAKELQFIGLDLGTMTVAGHTGTKAGNYAAVITLKDADNYVWSNGAAAVAIPWAIAEDVPVVSESYTVTVLSNDGGSFEYRLNNGQFVPYIGPVTAKAGTLMEIRAIADEGYSFTWDRAGTSGDTITMVVSGDTVLTGSFAVVSEEKSYLALLLFALLLIVPILLIALFLRSRDDEEEKTAQ